MRLEKTMFREYDIRGLVDEKQMNDRSVEFIGKGFGTLLKRKGVSDCVVGFDARSYSEGFKDALVKGLTSTGVNVKDIGLATTPLSYFAQYHLQTKGVAMVTASHNPNGWSGFKLGYDYSTTLLPHDIKELYALIESEDFEEGEGKVSRHEVLQAYIDDLVARVELKKKMKVVVNSRNGSASIVMPELLKRAGVEVVEQFCSVDFDFPNGNPNPSLEAMLAETADKVKEEKADLGLAFDGDGDRIGFVDEKGKTIYPDRVLILLARLILEKKPGAKIVFDVKSSQALPEDIEVHGGVPIMWKTGHSHIKQKGKEVGAALAGERSGHIFLYDNYYGFDDAAIVSLKLLEYVSAQDQPLSAIMAGTPQYVTSPVIHAHCADEVKYQVVEKIVEKFKKKFEKVIDVNGARVVFDDGWGLVRASSNVPDLVLVFEAKTEERVKEIEALFRKELAEFPEISRDWKNG
jgi:phosphomannomutase/phosphoglucomutase